MKIAAVYVGPLCYRIEYDPDLVHQGLDGKITHCEGVIRLRPNMVAPFERVILWHEILHALLHNAGLEIEDEERLIIALAHGITAVIQDNPELIVTLTYGGEP